MKYTLKIYHNGELVNTMSSESDQNVTREFAKVMVAKINGTKTRIVRKPYGKFKITQWFYDESLGEYKYAYEFFDLREI